MPTYDYRCTRCHRALAVEQSIRDKPLRRCVKCGGRLERQLPRNVSLIFRGSGFYATDYRKKEAPKPRSTKQPKDTKEGKD